MALRALIPVLQLFDHRFQCRLELVAALIDPARFVERGLHNGSLIDVVLRPRRDEPQQREQGPSLGSVFASREGGGCNAVP